MRNSYPADSSMASSTGKQGKGKAVEQPEAILGKFQQLRTEQRAIANKIAELEGEKNEHQLVIDALKDVDPDRRCFRMVGGVLAERTVKDVLPALHHTLEQLKVVTKKLTEQLEEKGKEVNAYREKHNIRFRGEIEQKKQEETKQTDDQSQGILVS